MAQISDEVFAMAAKVLDVQPPRKVAEKIKGRIQAGKCLLCDKPATRRGLCVEHYFAFRRALVGLSKGEVEKLKNRSVLAGKILPANYARKVKRPNPFLEN